MPHSNYAERNGEGGEVEEGGWGQTECVECQAKTILAIKANGACQKQFMWPRQKESREREREREMCNTGWQVATDT